MTQRTATELKGLLGHPARNLILALVGDDIIPLEPLEATVGAWLARASPERGVTPASLRGRETYIVFAPASALIHARFNDLVVEAIDRRPDAAVLYGDDGVAIEGRVAADVYCKPEFNLPLLLAQDYIGLPLIVRADALWDDGWPEITSLDFWFRFCAASAAEGIVFHRIPYVLALWPDARPRLAIEQRIAVLSEVFDEYDFVPGLVPGAIEARRRFSDHPEVTIVVPTNRSARGSLDGRAHILSFLDSLCRSTWPLDKVHVLIGDDCGLDDFYQQREWPFRLRVTDTSRAEGERFNYAKKVNALWRAAETELIVIMNDDIIIQSPDWLQALYTFGLDSDVGGVGARLLFPDRRLQHAGMIGGIYEVFAHPWYKKEADAPTYQDWAKVHRGVSAVTGAVFATQRSALEAVNGLDEGFALDFNDVDLCLKMGVLGYRIVYTPHAEMVHAESASRDRAFAPGDEIALFLSRWRDCIRDDPMFSPHLDRSNDDVKPLPMVTVEFGLPMAT